MAKTRMVNTRFWDDSYVSELEPLEKLLFLYFITNPTTNIAGIYELPLKKMVTDTGLTKERIEKSLKKFSIDQKIYYIDGWICVKNFQKHQSTNSTTVLKGIEEEMKKIPDKIKEMIINGYPIYTSSDRSIYLNLNSDIDSDSNLDVEAKKTALPSPHQKAMDFFSLDDKGLSSFCSELSQKMKAEEKYVSSEVRKFIRYWTEKNQKGTRERWEMERTFEVDRRLATWFGNNRNWGNKGITQNKYQAGTA